MDEKMEMEKPKTEVEEPGMGKEEEAAAHQAVDAAKLDGEKIRVIHTNIRNILVRNFDADKMREIMEKGGRRGRGRGRGCPRAHWTIEATQIYGNNAMTWPSPSASGEFNSGSNVISVSEMAALNGIMEALTCCDINTIGVCGPHPSKNDNLVEKVSRRAKRDRLFDVVIMASVSQEPNNKRIQDAVAEALGFTFDDGDEKDLAKRSTRLHIGQAFCSKFDDDEKKDAAERAERLRNRILTKQKILVILHDLHKGLDLDKVGVPLGADHTGCKLLLTSANEEVLSKEMHAQKIFNF